MTFRVSVHAQRRLRDIGERRVLCELERGHVLLAGDEVHRRIDLPARADDLGMAFMADHHEGASGGGVTPALQMDLGDERASGVEHRQAARLCFFLDRTRHAVRAENGHRAVGHVGTVPRRRPRPSRATCRRRDDYAQSRAAHRPARHSDRSRARRFRSPAPRRRRNRAGLPVLPAPRCPFHPLSSRTRKRRQRKRRALTPVGHSSRTAP